MVFFSQRTPRVDHTQFTLAQQAALDALVADTHNALSDSVKNFVNSGGLPPNEVAPNGAAQELALRLVPIFGQVLRAALDPKPTNPEAFKQAMEQSKGRVVESLRDFSGLAHTTNLDERLYNLVCRDLYQGVMQAGRGAGRVPG
jgi:hypothetical protein